MFANMKLGRAPKDPNAHHLMLAKYVNRDALPAAPSAWDGWQNGLASPVMGANDRLGDCVVVGMRNLLKMQSVLFGLQFPEISEQQLIDLYLARSGGVDSGLVMTDFIDWVIKNGFFGIEVIGRATLDVKNQSFMRIAGQMFGGLYMGFGLPNTAQNEGDHWSVQGDGVSGDSAVGSWGGHCMVGCGFDNTKSHFDKPGQRIGNDSYLTWAHNVYTTEHWTERYAEECYVILTRPMLERPGINKDELVADLRALNWM